MQVNRVSISEIKTSRLDPDYYKPEYLASEKAVQKFGSFNLGDAGKLFAGPFGSKLPSKLYLDEGIPLFRIGNVGFMEMIPENMAHLAPDVHQDIITSEVGAGDLLIVKASVSEKICKVPTNIEKANITQHIVALRSNGKYDTDYLMAFLFSRFGCHQLLRRSLGSIIQYLGISDTRSVSIPNVCHDVQIYIGNRVRQAESLKGWVKKLKADLDLKVSSQNLNIAVETELKKYSKATTEDLFPRLDPKYYGNRALKVLKATKEQGTRLGLLIESVCNGFEERDFVESGIDYITVSEVSSGRLDLSTSPKINVDIEIPQKAYINEKSVLVVRTGSIGTAIKVDKRDSDSVISSHLIKMQFKNESLATAVALFLNSKAGKVLQNKISYGAVQPQIGQDELLALWIPQFIIDKQDELYKLNIKLEDSSRAANSLIQSAKFLAEALIEGQITESQLIEAQQDLQEGDNSKDRAILSKLTDKGYLADDGKPLFTDLDKLYELLDEAQAAVDANEESV